MSVRCHLEQDSTNFREKNHLTKKIHDHCLKGSKIEVKSQLVYAINQQRRQERHSALILINMLIFFIAWSIIYTGLPVFMTHNYTVHLGQLEILDNHPQNIHWNTLYTVQL